MPLGEVEIALQANFLSQVLTLIGGALITANYSFLYDKQTVTIALWPFGAILLIVAFIIYGAYVLRKFSDWRSRKVPLVRMFGDSPSSSVGALVDFPVGPVEDEAEANTDKRDDVGRDSERRR